LAVPEEAAENLKRQALGRLLQQRNDHNAARSNPLIFQLAIFQD
jgi:hypothetical protein